VLGALPETFVTAAGSLEHLGLEVGETLLLRGATSSRLPRRRDRGRYECDQACEPRDPARRHLE